MQPKAGAKQATKTHRRSRTGCFTCRLRRKKCDEGKPTCRACKHLGLVCDYKRPVWWSSAEHRKNQKEMIKTMIKRTKLTEKAVHLAPAGSNTINRARSLSVESGFSLEHDAVGVVGEDYPHHHGHHDAAFMASHPDHYHYDQVPQQFPHAGGYEFDPYQKQQQPSHIGMLPMAHPAPSRRASSASSFASMRRDSVIPTPASLPETHHIPRALPTDDSEYGYFDFNEFPIKREHSHSLPPIQTQQISPEASPLPYIAVEDGDELLLNHFLANVMPLILPVLNAHGSARKDAILPALRDNECFRHCCLSIAALHLKTTQNLTGENAEFADQDITRHRYATIQGVCDALQKDSNHLQILEATLGMIVFQTAVGTAEDSLPDIPWHQHLQAASSLVSKLDLPQFLHPINNPATLSHSLNMTLTAWIDILGATMRGHAPLFADVYREKHLATSSSGLREMMGCDDRVMYLISEIACLENLRDTNTINDHELCDHVSSLAYQIELTEPPPDMILPPIIQSGHLDPRALTSTISAAFRLAARMYLCSLVPGFHRSQMQIRNLLDKMTATLESIPHGWESTLVWVYLIAGSVAGPETGFRDHFAMRVEAMGENSRFGSFGRMKTVLEEVWTEMDQGFEVRWRDVMVRNGCEALLI